MQIKIILSIAELEEAVKIHVAKTIKIEGYDISECSFIYDYDEEDSDEHTPIEGALILLEPSEHSPKSLPPSTSSMIDTLNVI